MKEKGQQNSEWRQEQRQEPVRRGVTKRWKMIDRYGNDYHFEGVTQAEADVMAREQITVRGYVYPRDVVLIEEEK
jgi:hypothetical protein